MAAASCNMGRLSALITALLIMSPAVWSKSCGPAFKGKCSCGIVYYDYDGRDQYIVNCTDTGFNDTSVLKYLPLETQVLIFTGNSISDLPWNVFGTLNNYTHLRVIDMSNNKIRDIKGKAYHHVGNVERLILNHNDLSISSAETEGRSHHHPRVFSNFVNLIELHLTDAFADNTPDELASDLHDIFVNSNLTRLGKLHLEQNEISSFQDRRVFCDLPNLKDLHLGDNLLESINFNIVCLPKLRFLDLERNRISALKEKDLETLDTFPARNQTLVIDLMGNPFSCDCAIRDLYKWLQTTSVTVRNRDALRCHRGIPEINGGESVVNLRKIQCAPTVKSVAAQSSSSHEATVIVLAILLVVLASLLVAVLYTVRGQLKARFTPLLNTVSQKVQYTSIGKHEDQEMNV